MNDDDESVARAVRYMEAWARAWAVMAQQAAELAEAFASWPNPTPPGGRTEPTKEQS